MAPMAFRVAVAHLSVRSIHTINMQDEIERLQALSAVQTADINALYLLVNKLAEILRRDHPDTPDLTDLFLRFRKAQLLNLGRRVQAEKHFVPFFLRMKPRRR